MRKSVRETLTSSIGSKVLYCEYLGEPLGTSVYIWCKLSMTVPYHQITSLKKNISRIDLLKIDAEKSEIDILKGIKKTDWVKIKNIIIESHTQDNSSFTIKILNKNGY